MVNGSKQLGYYDYVLVKNYELLYAASIKFCLDLIFSLFYGSIHMKQFRLMRLMCVEPEAIKIYSPH